MERAGLTVRVRKIEDEDEEEKIIHLEFEVKKLGLKWEVFGEAIAGDNAV